MTFSRRLTFFAFAVAGLIATSAAAGSRSGGVGLPMDPELLPPNSAPGDCMVRRVTGPGGAYRWDRVECDSRGGYQQGYGYGPVAVETRGDRYGERRDYGYQDVRAYGGGYDQGRGGPVYDGPPPYGAPYGAYDYVTAGRDEAGYLIWPGKTP